MWRHCIEPNFQQKKQRTKPKCFTNNSEVVTMHKIDMKHPKCIVTQPLKPNFYLTKLHVEIFRKRYWFRRWVWYVNSPCSSFVFVKEHIVPPSHLKPQEADFPRCGLLTFLAAEKQVGPVWKTAPKHISYQLRI